MLAEAAVFILRSAAEAGEKYEQNLKLLSDLMLLVTENLKAMPEGVKSDIEANSLVVCEALEAKGKEDLTKDLDRIRNNIASMYE